MLGRCILLLLISYESFAQTYVGPSQQAMGQASTALEGIYSITANPAGLAGLEYMALNVGYQHHFFATDITTQAAVFGVPTRLGTWGLVVRRYGMEGAYHDTKAGFAFARRFGPHLSAGMTASYHQLYIPNYLSVNSFAVDMGIQYHFEQGSTIGAQYTNIGNAGYGAAVYGTIPSFVKIGFSYPLAMVTLAVDLAYRFENRLSGHLGIAYWIGDILCLRGGLSVNPMQQHAGFGFRWQHFMFDVAATFHPHLGVSPQIGVGYAF
ncbi:hypothetical protein [Parapedobacter sp. 10938]|uniref:hypothetical protein n=1 Tax=Parapedobacter flavus TaxID=3110225 RepID=UPI002DBDF84E|nr:hypothetical protein [Parapedobacter sp. 10938]MEC3881364.1 hypothetical protein [Parapedobacter sp. 10938]